MYELRYDKFDFNATYCLKLKSLISYRFDLLVLAKQIGER